MNHANKSQTKSWCVECLWRDDGPDANAKGRHHSKETGHRVAVERVDLWVWEPGEKDGSSVRGPFTGEDDVPNRYDVRLNISRTNPWTVPLLSAWILAELDRNPETFGVSVATEHCTRHVFERSLPEGWHCTDSKNGYWHGKPMPPIWELLGLQDPDVFEREAIMRRKKAGIPQKDWMDTGKTTRMILDALEAVRAGRRVRLVADSVGAGVWSSRQAVQWAEQLGLNARLILLPIDSEHDLVEDRAALRERDRENDVSWFEEKESDGFQAEG